MQKKVRFFVVLLVCAALLVPHAAWAAPGEEEEHWAGDFRYIRLSGGIAITKYRGDETDVTVPDRIDGVRVQAVGSEAFAWNETITRVALPDSVQFLGLRAFAGCRNLQEICWPAGLLGIGLEACKDCSALRTVILPAGVDYLSESAFAGCTALEEVMIPGTVYDIAPLCFADCEKLRSVIIFGDATTADFSAEYAPFAGCGNMELFAYGGTEEALDELLPRELRDTVCTWLISHNAIGESVAVRACMAPAGQLVIPVDIGGARITAFEDDVLADSPGIDEIFYAGTQADWDEISIGPGNTLLGVDHVICLGRDPSLAPLAPCWNEKNALVTGISFEDLAGMPLRGLDLDEAEWTVCEDPSATEKPDEADTPEVPGETDEPEASDGADVPGLLFSATDLSAPDEWQEYDYEYTFSDAAGQELSRYEILTTGSFVSRQETELRSAAAQKAEIVIAGDVLGSGIMNVAQLVRLAQALSGQEPLEGIYLAAGDLDGSGQIDIGDLSRQASWLLHCSMP